jgi:putative chitobiose transport system permease protein
MDALCRYGILGGLVCLTLVPLLWLLGTALKGPEENLFSGALAWWPQQPTLQNFITVWQQAPMGLYFLNSAVVSALAVLLTLSTSVMMAYPLARFEFRAKPWVFGLVLASMFVPFQVLMIPLYSLVLHTGWVGMGETDWPQRMLALSVPFWVSGFGICFLKTAFEQLPQEIEECAMLDGCTPRQTLWHIHLPMLRPALGTLATLVFLASWGELLWPSIVLNEPNQYTLPLGLVQLQGAFSANWRLIAAAMLLSLLPVLLLFLLVQHWLLPNQNAGAVKG